MYVMASACPEALQKPRQWGATLVLVAWECLAKLVQLITRGSEASKGSFTGHPLFMSLEVVVGHSWL